MVEIIGRHAWALDATLQGLLAERMADPEPLLRLVRLTESEPSLLGCWAHVIGVTSRP